MDGDVDYGNYGEEEHEMRTDSEDESIRSLDHSSTSDFQLTSSASSTEIREFCLEKFRSTDFIMEPVLMEFLNRYFSADGDAAAAIEALSVSYEGIAQYVNIFAEWLIVLGVEPTTVQEHIETYLESILMKSFDPKKADRIFATEGGTPTWMTELITHKRWRKMIYKLVEAHRECLMLNFTIKLISDAGFQNEIPTTTTAVNQMEVYTRVFDSAIGRIIDSGEGGMADFINLITNTECTHLAAQLVMTSLVHDSSAGVNLIKVMQEVCESVKNQQILQTQLIAARGAQWPRAMQAIASMLSKKSLNPADIQTLFQLYSSAEPPAVALLRFKDLTDLLIDSLFMVDSKISAESRVKYIFLLAYSASVTEKWSIPSRKGFIQTRAEVNRDDLKITQEAIRKILDLIGRGHADVINELPSVFTFLRFPVIALVMIYWIGKTVKEPSYFKFAGESRNTPAHLIIIDEIASLHQNLHQKILDLLVELFESPWPQLDVLIRLELQKMFLDRLIHLISCGCVVPVLKYVKEAYTKQDSDVSLFRHFIVELLDVMAPPYSPDLSQLLYPLVSDTAITGTLRQPDGKDPVSVFLQDCKAVLRL